MSETNIVQKDNELMVPDAVGERDIPVFNADSGESHTVAVTATSGESHVRDEVEARKHHQELLEKVYENSLDGREDWRVAKR